MTRSRTFVLALSVLTVLMACSGDPDVALDASGAPVESTTVEPGLRVAFLPAGPHPYFDPWGVAARDAGDRFGFAESVYRVPDEWSYEAQEAVLEKQLDDGFNSFVLFPSDAELTARTIDELAENGIPAVSAAGCVDDPSAALFCVATDVQASAYLGTKALIEVIGGQGVIVHVSGWDQDPNTQLRKDGVEQAADETGGAVVVLEHLTDIDSLDTATAAIEELLAERGNEINGIVGTAYTPSLVAAALLVKRGDGAIRMVGIDDDPAVLNAIERGLVDGTMAQNPYGQAMVAAYALSRIEEGCTIASDAPFLRTGQTARFFDSGTMLITSETLDTYVDDLKLLSEELIASFEADYLSC